MFWRVGRKSTTTFWSVLSVMKRIAKEVLGRCVIPVAELLPTSKKFLRRLGLRTSQGLFGQRIVSVQFANGRCFRLTHVDESYLAFQLFWRGGQFYEPLTRVLLEAALRPGDTF